MKTIRVGAKVVCCKAIEATKTSPAARGGIGLGTGEGLGAWAWLGRCVCGGGGAWVVAVLGGWIGLDVCGAWMNRRH